MSGADDMNRDTVADIEKIAREVTADHPDYSLSRRLNVAMKRCKGHLNPRMVHEALVRCAGKP